MRIMKRVAKPVAKPIEKQEKMISLTVVEDALKAKFDSPPMTAIRRGIRDGAIPHTRSSQSDKSKIFVFYKDVQKFLGI